VSVLIIVGLILLFIMMIVVLVVMVILLMIWLPSILARGILSGLGCFGFALRLRCAIGPAKEITHDGLHPLRKRGKALVQVIADGGTMSWILQHRDEARADSIHVAGQQVAQPIERLNNAHGGTPRPMEAAGCRMLKLNGQIAELDGFQPRIRKYDRTRRHGVGETQVIRCCDPIDNHTYAIAPGERINSLAIVGVRGFARDLVGRGFIVETASDPAYIF
jgi:hypothetical protein